MQKLMMQPEYIIPMHLCKVESCFVKKSLRLYQCLSS